jgi:hypothetical protein
MNALRQSVLMNATTGGTASPTHMSVSAASRALTILPAVLDLDISWNARLVLSEVLDLHKVNGKVWANDEHFTDRCRVAKRTIGAALKELEDAGLLHRNTNQSAALKRILTPLIYPNGTPRPMAESAIDLLQNLQEPIAKSATDLLQILPQPIADSADINTSLNNKGNNIETPTQKKMGEGVSNSDSSPSPSQKNTAPNPVAAPPSLAATALAVGSVNPCLAPGTEESKALATEMATYWKIPQHNARRQAQFATFTRTLNAAGRLEEVRTQFDAYRRYQQLRGLSRFGIEKYLGHELEGYTDGEWCGAIWSDVLAEATQQQQSAKKPFGPVEAPARASASPQRKQSWS